MDFSGSMMAGNPNARLNPHIFHEIDTWNFTVNDVNDYFLIKQPTPVVIAPGSDMPYCLVHWVGNIPGNGDGWPAQAANPGAYVQLGEPHYVPDEVSWSPILLSHKPTWLRPGYYVPALPMMAYMAFSQWDHEHAWPTTIFEYPKVRIAESIFPEEIIPYQFTTKALSQTDTSYLTPWMLSPIATGLCGTAVGNFTFSKVLGFGGSNRTGTNQVATATCQLLTKSLTFPDIVANYNTQDLTGITAMAQERSNSGVERFCWFKLRFTIDGVGSTPAGVGYLVY